MVIESRSRCSFKGGYLVVRNETTTMIHLSEISTIVMDSTACYMGTYLLVELAKQKIPVVICDQQHNPIGEYLPLYGAHNTSRRTAEQLTWGEPSKKRVWQSIVKEKIRQQARLLSDLGLADMRVLHECMNEVRSGDVTNREAYAARVYFNALFGPTFVRSEKNDINACLDYGYAILLSTVNKEIVARGYMTQIGICHRSEYNQFNLACDFMEPFRPVIDRVVSGCSEPFLDGDMRHLLVDVVNCTVNYLDGSYKLASVVSLYVQDCFNALFKRIAPEDIVGFEMP